MCSEAVAAVRPGRAPVFWTVMLVLFVSLPSCTVKEDRSLCPCVFSLVVHPGECPYAEALLILEDGAGKRTRDTLRWDGGPVRCQKILSRGRVRACLVAPPQAVSDSAGSITIPEGAQCPAVWTDYGDWTLEEESLTDTLSLCKNYCRLTLQVQDVQDESYPFILSVRGGICGYLPDGGLAEGDFRSGVLPGGGRASVWLPRQRDASLKLDILDRENVLRTFSLGVFLEEQGFDWEARDLQDALVRVDYARTTLRLQPEAWLEVHSEETVI